MYICVFSKLKSINTLHEKNAGVTDRTPMPFLKRHLLFNRMLFSVGLTDWLFIQKNKDSANSSGLAKIGPCFLYRSFPYMHGFDIHRNYGIVGTDYHTDQQHPGPGFQGLRRIVRVRL